MTIQVPTSILDELFAHARSTFPEECCGILIERGAGVEAVRVTNVQNAKHAEHPESFPRTATTAYTMGPEAAPILVAHDKGELTIRAIYHSHPQHAAYFSAEDRAQATVWDEPSYPEAAQIVISVIDGTVRDAKAFRWDAAVREFVEVPLRAG
ncbi:MAG: Mov34/MPN/PAD-1 family protein [Candidatus Binatia bacterium]